MLLKSHELMMINSNILPDDPWHVIAAHQSILTSFRFRQLQRDVSLKTVLLLAVFAAIDIAASAGFVLVRLIMVIIHPIKCIVG